jgi:hypothetical protein
MKSNWDKYLEPPDEPEAVYCESCGQEQVEIVVFGKRTPVCTNPYCPDKHSGTAREMAEMVINLMEEVIGLRGEIKRLEDE